MVRWLETRRGRGTTEGGAWPGRDADRRKMKTRDTREGRQERGEEKHTRRQREEQRETHRREE